MNDELQKDVIKLKKEVDELIKQNKILKLKLQGVLQSLDRNKKDYIARDDMVKNTLLQTLQQMIGNIRKWKKTICIYY